MASFESEPITMGLFFWGEWEGPSIFTPIGSGKPSGIHEPFHSVEGVGRMNTDPYVFGSDFKYATCSQTGQLVHLSIDSIVFFGTSTDKGFELDTVFVVKSFEPAKSVFITSASAYSKTYKDETLEPLGETYLGPGFSTKKRIYRSATWWDNPQYFSFVPCRTEISDGLNKVILPTPPFSKQKIGHPFLHFENFNHVELWKYVVEEVLRQGYYLGIRLNEPLKKASAGIP